MLANSAINRYRYYLRTNHSVSPSLNEKVITQKHAKAALKTIFPLASASFKKFLDR